MVKENLKPKMHKEIIRRAPNNRELSSALNTLGAEKTYKENNRLR